MKKLITSLALALTALSSYAITPLWMRDARISPNGTEIVFCYKGDIYKVPAQGGTAVQLTTQASYEANPGLVARRKTNCICQRPEWEFRPLYHAC